MEKDEDLPAVTGTMTICVMDRAIPGASTGSRAPSRSSASIGVATTAVSVDSAVSRMESGASAGSIKYVA